MKTDAEGRFELRGLKPGKYSVNAEAEGGSARAEEIAHDALDRSLPVGRLVGRPLVCLLYTSRCV